MYNYDFNGDNIKEEYLDKTVEINGKVHVLNVVLTSKKLMFFKNVVDTLIEKSLGVCVTPEYELLFEMNLCDIKCTCEDNDTHIAHADNMITIYDLKLNANCD